MRKKTSSEELKKRRNKFIQSTPQGASGRVKNRKVEEPVKKKVTAKPTTKSQRQAKAKAMAKANIKKYPNSQTAKKARMK